ncbi:MAG: SPASM domain-containing protein [Nitrososphaerales archaeon]
MCDLFDHWIEAGAVVDVLPLSEWLDNVLREILGQRGPTYDRRRRGESVLLVETNGDLYQTDERGRPELRLGNLMRDSIERILASPAYEASLVRSEKKAARFCHACRHYGFCNGYPIHAEPFAVPPTHCPVTSAVHDHIARYLVASGYDASTLMSLLRQTVPARPV